jgi:hypothetical protein
MAQAPPSTASAALRARPAPYLRSSSSFILSFSPLIHPSFTSSVLSFSQECLLHGLNESADSLPTFFFSPWRALVVHSFDSTLAFSTRRGCVLDIQNSNCRAISRPSFSSTRLLRPDSLLPPTLFFSRSRQPHSQRGRKHVDDKSSVDPVTTYFLITRSAIFFSFFRPFRIPHQLPDWISVRYIRDHISTREEKQSQLFV